MGQREKAKHRDKKKERHGDWEAVTKVITSKTALSHHLSG